MSSSYTGATNSSDEHRASPIHGEDLFEIDVTVAHPARLRNYLAGGEDSFAADRDAADYLSAVLPDGIETARANVRAMGAFTAKVVRHLVTEGVRQFLHIGAAIPTGNDVHEVAQGAAPDSRVVYVGSDPVVLAHAHKLRTVTPEGATAYIHGTLRDPQKILQQAAHTLDLARPVAVMFPGTLNFVPDERDPYGIVAQLMKGVPPGSHLVVYHATNDIPAEGAAEAAKRLSETLREPYVVRSHSEISRFFDGLAMLGPGLVQIDLWDGYEDRPMLQPQRLIPIYGAVARKP